VAQEAVKTRRGREPDRVREAPREFEERLGYRFHRKELLLRALTHSSYAHEIAGGGSDNEPLEFLGDALLGCLISERLFLTFPGLDEGHLSRYKASLVNAEILAAKARRLSVGAYLLLGRTAEKVGARTKGSLLSDAFEALVAAIYLDGGFDPARAFLDRLFAADIQKLIRAGVPDERDAKTHLQELLQSRGLSTPRYQILKESGPAHRRNFLVGVLLEGKLLAQGRGRTRKAAEQAAARKVLQELRESAGKTGRPAGSV
jgi:ribonuclease III